MAAIKTGLAGYGAAAKVMHAPFLKISEHYNVVSVLERHNNESRHLFPDAFIVRSFEELISVDEIDLIIITTPNETHFTYTKEALLKGKHVVLEKPFTITSLEALELIDIARSMNKILSVFQNRRYVADFLTIKEILNKRLLGDVHEFEGHFDRYRPELKINAWREERKPGSGILYDLGSHLIDQSLYLFGLPQSIVADVRIQRNNAVIDDYFDIEMNYGFTKVILKAGMLVRELGPRYMIHGTKGSFIKYGEDPQEALLKAGHLPLAPDWGAESEDMYGLLHTETNDGIIKMKYSSQAGNFGFYYQNLYHTIIDGEELKEKPEHGYNTIRIIELALESNDKKASVDCTNLINIKY